MTESSFQCGSAEASPQLPQDSQDRDRMRLLLVEDDTMIGEVVLDLLRAEHYAVDWVKDGEMADTALRQSQNYDLVLLDLGLPRLDGLEVLRAMRARKDRTPVLVATARDAV